MSRFIIQILAMLLMTIDHIGMLLITDPTLYEIMRLVGRLAFPLFAFLLGEGFRHTSNIKKYLFRLFIFGFLIEAGAFIGQFIFGNTGHTELNIYLTLFMGLLISSLIMNKKIYIKLLSLIPLFIVFYTDTYLNSIVLFGKTLGITFEYGLYGILIILSFTLFKKPLYQSVALCLTNLLFINGGFLSILNINCFTYAYSSEILTLLIIPVLFLYNGKCGIKIPKYITYLYYPAHLLILFLLS